MSSRAGLVRAPVPFKCMFRARTQDGLRKWGTRPSLVCTFEPHLLFSVASCWLVTTYNPILMLTSLQSTVESSRAGKNPIRRRMCAVLRFKIIAFSIVYSSLPSLVSSHLALSRAPRKCVLILCAIHSSSINKWIMRALSWFIRPLHSNHKKWLSRRLDNDDWILCCGACLCARTSAVCLLACLLNGFIIIMVTIHWSQAKIIDRGVADDMV